MKKNYSTMTMPELKKALVLLVDEYNLSTNSEERIELAVEQKTVVDTYNELSLYTAYGECLKAELPIKALAEMYYYNTISTKDAVHTEVINGKTTASVTRSIAESSKKLNLYKFIEWATEANKTVTAQDDWKKHCENARNEIISQWKKFFETNKDSSSMSIGKTKKAIQAMFDSLVFIKTASGKNAVIANKEIAKWVLGFANTRKDSKADDGTVKIVGNILSKQMWATLTMDALHKVFTENTFYILYGDEAVEETEAEAEVEAEAEAESK